MATQNLLLDPLPTGTITGVGMPMSPDYVLPDDVVATENTEKDLLSYFNSKEASSITNLTKDQKDAAVSGFRDFVRITAESNADPGMVLPEKFEIPAYSEYNGPIFEAQFPAIKTPDDLINFGMLDENGPTDKGRLMIDLKKIGGLNRDYTLNLTGKALLSDQAESLKPENLPIFMERKRLKLDDPEEKSWGTIWDEFTGVLKSTYEMGMAISPTMIAASLYNQDDKAKEVLSAERNAMVEAGVSGIVKFQNTLASGASTIARGLLIRATEEGKQQDIELAALDQNFKRNQFQQQAFKSSEALHEITGLTNWVDQMSNAKEQLGEAGFQKAQEIGEVGGQMLFSIINPLAPENVAFNLGMKATIAPFKVAGAMVGTARKTSEVFAEASSNLEAININLAKTQAAGQAATKYSASLQTAAERLTAEGNIAAAKSVGKQIVKSNNIAQKAVFQAEQWTKLAGEASQKVDFLAPSAARANKIIKVADISAQFPKLITTPVGFTLQKVGRGMIKIDAGLEAASQKMGAGKFYNAMTKWSSMAGIGTFGAVSGLPPSMAWFPAAFKLAWSTAPVIEAAGDFVRVVGREASAARGAIPMWRKIGRMQNAGPAHRMIAGLMDVATLGGFPVAQNAIKGTVAATAASVPLDLALSYVASGGETNPNALRESIVGNAFFSGGGATLGAIQMGSKGTLKKLQIGDVLNFRRSIAEPQQRMMFDAMPRGFRDAIGSYSGSKPNTRIEFVKEGGGNYDPSTNTIRINPNSKNPLAPLIAHEVLEAIVVQSNMGEAIRTLLVGDGVQTGGLLRDRNGNLDPKFIEFRDRYNQLRQAEVNRINQTRPPENRESFTPLNDRDMAKEYFIEMNADDMAGLAESGQLGKLAARSAASRKMIDLGNTILNKSSIFRNLHFNLGGVMDSGGKMVMGNGLLADNIRQLPEAKAMFQKMVRDTAGRPNAVKMTAEKSKGSVIPTSGMDDPLWSEMTAYWKTDQAGVPIKDKNGNWVPLERYVEQAREQAGLLIQADQKQRIAAGETIPKHEIQYSPETGWRGKYFSAAQIEIIKNSGYFNDSQIRLFDHVNNAAKRGQGERFLMIYNPATSSRLRGRGSKRYETLGPTMKEGGILGFSMGQKGQLLIDIIDTQQLHQNVMEQAGKKIGQKLQYKGNIDKILTDINAVMKLHGEGESADIHFKQEYGADWKAHKDFINSTFGDISGGAKARPADYMMINPVLVTDRPTNAVFKTYRLDRLNKATAMEGTTGIPMDYNMVKANYMPDGVPLFTGDGEPVDLRYTAVEDENGLRAVPGANYGKKNNVALGEQLRQNEQVPNGPRTEDTQTGDRTIEGNAPKTGELQDRRSMEGSTVRVRPPDSSPDWNVPLNGLPRIAEIQSQGGKVEFGPNVTARKAAWDYAESAGIKYNPPQNYFEVTKEFGKKNAAAFEAMVHAPDDPAVKASYDAMIKETIDQYQFIKKTGLKIEAIPKGMEDPYLETPRLAILDVQNNNHLWFFPTDSGFGTEGFTDKIKRNLLEVPSGEFLDGKELLANDVFRIVHDYFGHIKEGVGFRASGEDNAWRSHSAMYSDLARPAMTAETRGQNMEVNFGIYAEQNRGKNGSETIYSEQKNALPPEWMVTEGASDTPSVFNKQYMPEVAPEPIDKKLQNEINQLQDQIDGMYKSGRTKGVEDLEAKLETLLEKADTDLSAIEIESMQEFDSANPSPEEALVNQWYRWTGKGIPNESADLQADYPTFGAFFRSGHGDTLGKVKDIGVISDNITDKQIEQAAKEAAAAYERRRDALRSSARDRNVTKAVNINDSTKQGGQNFTDQIISGKKTIETRDSPLNALQPLLGQRIGLASTGKGKGTTRIVGYATVGDQPIIYNNEAEFRKDQGKHLVPQGSKYDIKQGQKKYGYELKDVVAVKPFAPKSTNIKYSVIDPSSNKQYMPEVSSKESGKPIDLMAYTSVGGDPDMIMSAKWGRTKSGINPETGKKQAAQTSALVANSSNPEDHQVGFQRIDSLLKASDLDPAQKIKLESFVIKTAGFAVDSPGFRDLPVPKTLTEARNTIAKVKDRMAKNLLSIYDAVPPPVRNYWQRWYPLAYEWNNAQSKVHSIPARAIAGINARLSPGKDWIHNVNMTERILSAFTNGISMTSEIAAGAVPLIDAALDTKLNQKDNRGKPQKWKQDLIDKANKAKKEINAMVGMNIVDMNSKQAARLIRFHTQVVGENRVLNYFEKGNPVYADGISWQSTVNIEKAINIYLDPTIENISANMGDDHKIRSFYNNQVAPHDPTLRDVTSDTHAVAATYLLPLSQSSLQVSRNFGTTSNSVAGMSGMYYIVADAYRMAADARGVEPRAMQSITWEGVRSMYPRGFKNNKANIKKVEAIWNRVETKQISKQQALQEINGLMIDFFSKNPDSRPRVTVLPTR